MELIVQFCLNPIFGIKLHFQPRALVSYAASIIMYNRLRAAIHLDYDPIFNEEKSILNSANWYEKWYTEYCNSRTGKENSGGEIIKDIDAATAADVGNKEE